MKNKESFSANPINRYDHDDVIIHQVKSLYQGFFKIDEYKLSHRLFDGGKSPVLVREIFERGDAVVVMPYDPVLDRVVLLEQFRPGMLRSKDSPWLLEFVAGMFDDNESPEEVAIREAQEEADLLLTPEDLHPVMKYFSSPGGTTECIHMFAATIDSSNVAGIYGLPEEGEDILLHVLSRDEALALLAQGKITNASTIIGLQWLALNYKSLQSTA